MILRPVDAAGQTFATSAPLAIIDWLTSEGWAMTRDEPALVELTRGVERLRIAADGRITPLGDESHRTARMLLLNSE